MNEFFMGEKGERTRTAILVAVIVLVLFLGVKTFAELKGIRYVGADIYPSNTITVSGDGEAFGVADVAEFSFTVSAEASTVAAAQKTATDKINAITAYLDEQGIEEKDIKTVDYSVYPQYDYQQITCISYPCDSGRQVLRGYQVRQSTSVKIHDTEKAGDLLTGVGSAGATEVSGLNFTFDDPDALTKEARGEAIEDAKAQAEELSRQLGVKLVRIVSFSENGYEPYPYYDKAMSLNMGGAEGAMEQSAPAISVGQNKVTSSISITYEIR